MYENYGKCADLAGLPEPKTVNVSFSLVFVCFRRRGGDGQGGSKYATGMLQAGSGDVNPLGLALPTK